MSTDSPSSSSLRRTRSTGDIPTSDVPRPELALLSPSCRHSESHPSPAVSALLPPRSATTTATDELQTSRGADVPIAPQTSVHSPPSRIWTLPHTVEEERVNNVPDPEINSTEAHNDTSHRPNRSTYAKLLAFFGVGRNASRTRRELVTLIRSLCWGSLQIIAIIVVLSLAAVTDSPTSPGLNEWKACDKPLGIWCCIWVFRAILSCSLAYLSWVRERAAIVRDVESNNLTLTQTQAPFLSNVNGIATQPLSSGGITVTTNAPNVSDIPLPRSRLYSRLIIVHSLITLAWFLTAHVLEYTSVYTCRHSSPLLWWLTFSILSIMYIKVLEIVFLGVAVFIVAPILFLFWNILLICVGRHPLQNPATVIKPEIEKLPKSIIDAIPLVMYIPPPPDEPSNGPITVPENVHAYPPKPSPPPVPPKRRFRFLRRRLSPKEKQKTDSSDAAMGDAAQEKAEGGEMKWEDCWEQGDYPFVRLEGNRAACAICLLDFAEPKRVAGATAVNGEQTAEGKASAEDNPPAEGDIQEIVVENVIEEDIEAQLKLADAGDGPQPLRLLECGHVFHKTCLDPWLQDVSGRCPLCQRAVVIPDVSQRRRRRR